MTIQASNPYSPMSYAPPATSHQASFPLHFGVISDGQKPMVLDTGAQIVGPSLKYAWLDGPRLAWKSLKAAVQGKSLSDNSLANLDDQIKQLGGLGIASLGAAGALKGILSVGEFVGFTTWFGAMALTPMVINGIYQAFTGGVNLGQEYINSKGERKQFFLNPQYTPLSLLRDSQKAKLSKRFNINNDDPDRNNKLERQLQKLSTQSRSWWMLVAGPATPIISGLVTDRLQGPVAQGVHRLQNAWSSWRLEQALNHASKNADTITKGANVGG